MMQDEGVDAAGMRRGCVGDAQKGEGCAIS